VHPLVEVGSTVAVVVLVAEATRGRKRRVARAPGVDRGFAHESGSRDAMLRVFLLPRRAWPASRGFARAVRPDPPQGLGPQLAPEGCQREAQA
jgi:hypothetical protein